MIMRMKNKSGLEIYLNALKRREMIKTWLGGLELLIVVGGVIFLSLLPTFILME